MTTKTPGLKDRWNQLLQAKPKTRIRDAAKELGVSEMELLATGIGDNVVRLEGDWTQLIKDLPRLGPIMCLTRNEAAVHERHGEFQKIDFFHGMGQVVGPDIDLRLFLKEWKHGFAVTAQTSEGELQSLQFFDGHGTAIHKIYLQKRSNYGGYGVLLDQFRSQNQSTEASVAPPSPGRPALPDAEVDVEGFRQAWKDLKDTHAFFMLLHKFRINREQAARLAPEGYSRQVSLKSTRLLLEKAAETKLPIMVFIGSPGCVQIHTGPVENIKMFGEDWLNVLDDKFSMHLYEPLVKSAWVIRKPTTEGDITSLELYNEKGDDVVLFFGKRKPGSDEMPEWRELVNSLPSA